MAPNTSPAITDLSKARAMPMDTPKRSPLPRTVLVVGVVSMLNDFASEMVIPLIPLLLVTVLAA